MLRKMRRHNANIKDKDRKKHTKYAKYLFELGYTKDEVQQKIKEKIIGADSQDRETNQVRS